MTDGTGTDGGARYVEDLVRRMAPPVPAKCPACDGWGTREPRGPLMTAGTRLPARIECPACEGAGVLWPPRGER